MSLPRPRFTKRKLSLLVGTVALVGLAVFVTVRISESPRNRAISSLKTLEAALQTNDVSLLLRSIKMPAAAPNGSNSLDWAREVLSAEISPEGLQEFADHARFGSLTEIFPEEGPRWAEAAGVKGDQCMALSMTRGGIRAEVVLWADGDNYRVVRCNNVSRMARES